MSRDSRLKKQLDKKDGSFDRIAKSILHIVERELEGTLEESKAEDLRIRIKNVVRERYVEGWKDCIRKNDKIRSNNKKSNGIRLDDIFGAIPSGKTARLKTRW